jgi:SAM-dependent methyltransferase
MDVGVVGRDLEKAARRGEPSYVWRAGQDRRLALIEAAAGATRSGIVLDAGCGVGAYLDRLADGARLAVGVELDAERAAEARTRTAHAGRAAGVVRAVGEALPFRPGSVDLVLSHEVLEHVADDRRSVEEIARVLRPGGRAVVFVPNRGYPFETHGVYWRGRYRFGNFPLVNYLPSSLRNRLAPHVRAYRGRDLEGLFAGLPVRIVSRTVIFGAYDNIIARWPRLGRVLRGFLGQMERTPLRGLGLSHVWVLERV